MRYLKQRSQLVPGHSANGTRWALIVNTPFFQVPPLELGHLTSARGRDLVLGYKSRHCLYAVFISSGTVHCFVLDVLTGKLNFKMASAKAKWSDHLHSDIPGTQCVKPTPFCAGN